MYNATISEFMKAKRLSPEGEEQVVVISVSQHKTGVEWTAKLMLSNLDYTCLREYMVCIWPSQDGERTLENMLVLCGPRSLLTSISTFKCWGNTTT